MPRVKVKSTKDEPISRTRPAATSEGREMQLVAKAFNLAERQLDDGTASSQVITHFLKLGTEKAKLERAKLEHETALLEAKTEAMKSAQHSDEMFEKAIRAMKNYQGAFDDED